MQRFFLESPWMLIPALVILQLVLIKIWSALRTRRTRRIMNIGFVLCVALPMLQWLVTTPREQVEHICEALVSATEAGNITRIAELTSPGFRSGDIDRGAFLRAVESALTRVTVEHPILRGLHIDITAPERATAQFGIMCRLITSTELMHNHVSTWTVTLVRTSDGWLLKSVTPRPGPVFPFSSLHQILRATQ